MYYRVVVKSGTVADSYLGLNARSATFSSFDVVPLLLSKIRITRIIYIIELLRISNKKTHVRLVEQILIDKLFTQT